MPTVQDILTRAALNIGAVQANETLDTFESTDILAAWNALIASNSIQRASVFNVSKDAYTLTPGVQAYTLGTGGSISAVRPVRITGVNVLVTAGSTQTKTPLLRMDDDEWRELPVSIGQGTPQRYYHDRAYPLSTLSFYVTPDHAYGVEVYSWAKLSQQVNLTDTVSFPEGYERFWVLKLAVEIAPMFSKEPSPTLLALMAEAEQAVKSLNRRSPRLISDPAVLHRGGRNYNFKTGTGLL